MSGKKQQQTNKNPWSFSHSNLLFLCCFLLSKWWLFMIPQSRTQNLETWIHAGNSFLHPENATFKMNPESGSVSPLLSWLKHRVLPELFQHPSNCFPCFLSVLLESIFSMAVWKILLKPKSSKVSTLLKALFAFLVRVKDNFPVHCKVPGSFIHCLQWHLAHCGYLIKFNNSIN